MARVSTGLAGLDARLGGGVLPGTLHLLIGEPINAFELFPRHFAIGGQDLKNGVRYASVDEPARDVLKSIAELGGNPKRVQVFDVPKGNDWALPPPQADHRIVLDSFTSFSQAKGFEEAYQTMRSWRLAAKRTGATILITVLNKVHSELEMSRLKRMADGVIEIGFDRQGFGLYPYAMITKMRGIPDVARLLLLKETDQGLFVESTRRVF